MSKYDYLSLAIYFLLILSIGTVFNPLNRDSKDYFAGSFKVTWWLLGTSMFISNFSAWAFTGGAHMAYTYGVIIFIIPLSDVIGYFLAYCFYAARLRQLRVVTAMLAVRKRFGRAIEQVYTCLSLVSSLVTMTVWMVGLSIILSSVFPMSQTLVIVFSGILVTFLALFGGSWGIVASDFVQLILIGAVNIAVFFLAVFFLGGFSELFAKVPESHWNPVLPGSEPYDLWWALGFILMSLIARNNLTTAYRYIAAKDSQHARRAALIPLFGFLFLPITWYLVPMVAESITPGVLERYDSLPIPSEASYVAVAKKLLPNGMLGLLVAAIIATTVSSMGSALNRNAGYIVKSVLIPVFFKDGLDENKTVRAGRWATASLSGLAIFSSIYFVHGGKLSLFDMYQLLDARLTVPLSVPVFWGLFFKRIPNWGAIATIIFGTLVSTIIFNGLDTPFGRLVLGWFWNPADVDYIVSHPITWSFLVNVPLSSAFCLLTMFVGREKPMAANQSSEFFADVARPVDFEMEVGGDNSAFQAKTVGQFLMVYALFIGLMLLIPNPPEGRFAIAGVTALLLVLGTILMAYARKLSLRS